MKEQSIRNETKFGVKQKKWSKLRNNNGGREMVKLQVDIGMPTLATPLLPLNVGNSRIGLERRSFPT